MRFIKLLFTTIIVAGCIAAASVCAVYKKLIHWSRVAMSLPAGIVVALEPGESLNILADKLHSAGVITSSRNFEWWVRWFDDYSKFQAGSYKFEAIVAPRDVARQMRQGEVYLPAVLQITVPEGFTFKQIVERLAANGIGRAAEFNKLARNEEFLKTLRIPAQHIEGYLYPATYPFFKTPSPEEALTLMVKTFWEKLPPRYEEQTAQRGLNLNEAVIFASLIEAETLHDEEKPLVSEVIWRRFKAKRALGIDATIIYGLKEYNGNLTRAHLQDARNPYNSRVHTGLPPTPICSPSANSLRAVLTPTEMGYYYYVLDPERPGFHYFSETAAEHNQHVRKLVLANKQKKSE